MSCFVVPAFHIDALVSWAVDHGAPAFIEGRNPAGLGREFHRANISAYQQRYGERCEEDYKFTRREGLGLTPVQVIKACDCLAYQCSDASDWAGSVAAWALDRIREHAIRHLPGYQDAAWTLDQGVTA